MKKDNEAALIDNEVVTSDYLFGKACTLTEISQEMQVITDFLDYINYAVKNRDNFTAEYFIAQNKLGNVVDTLQNVTKAVSEISTDICPDRD